jgi:hypothetical protein
VIAQYAGDYRREDILESAAGIWLVDCSGISSTVIGFVTEEEPPSDDRIVTVSGSAYSYPEGGIYRASFAMDITTETAPPSGWLNYYYTRTRMFFKSTAITEVTASDSDAVIKGAGSVNGLGGYTFEAFVTDGNPDRFGIIIKRADGSIFYNAAIKDISGGDLKINFSAAVTACAGDLDDDGDVDGKDLAIIISSYGRTDCTAQSPCKGNFDDDEDVDMDDLLVLIKNFGKIDCQD